MTLYGEGIVSQSAKMLHNDKYEDYWLFDVVPSSGATLFQAPGCSVELIAELLQSVTVGDAELNDYFDSRSAGKQAAVYIKDDVAVKIGHNNAPSWHRLRLVDAIANVGLHKALAAEHDSPGHVSINAPKIHAIVEQVIPESDQIRVSYIMDRLSGRHPSNDYDDLSNEELLYRPRKALKAIGISEYDITLDSCNENVLVETDAQGCTEKLHLFDARASSMHPPILLPRVM